MYTVMFLLLFSHARDLSLDFAVVIKAKMGTPHINTFSNSQFFHTPIGILIITVCSFD